MDRDRDSPCVDQHNIQGNIEKEIENCRHRKISINILREGSKISNKNLRPDA